MGPFDPFSPHAIARARHAETSEQRTARESYRAHQVNPHLSNAQVKSLFDIAEAILQHGFAGIYHQTMRLARSTRTVLLENRNLTLDAQQPSVMGPHLQALRAAPVTQVPAQPTPIVQALMNARDYTPATAAQSSAAADDTRVQADQSPPFSQQSSLATEQSYSAANNTGVQAEQPPPFG